MALTIDWQTALFVAGLYVLINQVEGNLITPKIQGTAVRVHPLLIFVSVIGGSQIAGPIGAILAVPTLAVVRVLAEFLWERLRVHNAHDTVLVALGGEDDGERDLEVTIAAHEEDSAAIHAKARPRISIGIPAPSHRQAPPRGPQAHIPAPTGSDLRNRNPVLIPTAVSRICIASTVPLHTRREAL